VTGFTPDEISGVFELLSGLLNLGNIEFKGYSLPNGTDASKLKRVDESKQAFIIFTNITVLFCLQSVSHMLVTCLAALLNNWKNH